MQGQSQLIETPEAWRTWDAEAGQPTRAPITAIYDWAMKNMQPGDEVHGFSPSLTGNPSRYPFHLRRRSCYVEGVVNRPGEVIVLRCGEVGKYLMPSLIHFPVPAAELSNRAPGNTFQTDRAQYRTFRLYASLETGAFKWIDRRDPNRTELESSYCLAHNGWAARKIGAMMGWGEPFDLFTEHLTQERRDEVLEAAKSRGIYPGTFNNLWSVVFNFMRDKKNMVGFLDSAEARELVDIPMLTLYRLALEWKADYPLIDVRSSDNEQLDAYREKFFSIIERMRTALNVQI